MPTMFARQRHSARADTSCARALRNILLIIDADGLRSMRYVFDALRVDAYFADYDIAFSRRRCFADAVIFDVFESCA